MRELLLLFITGPLALLSPEAQRHIENNSASRRVGDAPGWQDSLARELGEPWTTASEDSRGCRYEAGTALDASSLPPRHAVWLSRQPIDGGACEPSVVVVGHAYGDPQVALAEQVDLGLVLTFSGTATPSGAAHRGLSIVHVDETSGLVRHHAELLAMAPSITDGDAGNVLSGMPILEVGGALNVLGEKSGVLPGESGAGQTYEARFEDFLIAPPGLVAADQVVAR